MSQEENENDEYIDFRDLTPDDWLEIKALALEVYKSGKVGHDSSKCAIYAFLQWITENEIKMGIPTGDDSIVH